MKYNLTYRCSSEMLQDYMDYDQEHCLQRAKLDPGYKDIVADSYLSDFDEPTLDRRVLDGRATTRRCSRRYTA